MIYSEPLEQAASDLLSREYGKDHPAARHDFTVTFRTTTHAHQVRELAAALKKEGDSLAAEMRERAARVPLDWPSDERPTRRQLADAIRALPLEKK